MYNRRMSILLLDSRHPLCVPLDVVVHHQPSIAYTDAVPGEVQQALSKLGASSANDGNQAELLVAVDAAEPLVAARIAAGEQVVAAGASISVAQQVMGAAVARGEWERAQTHVTLLPYLHEEVAEFDQAVRHGTPEQVCDELSDVLLQVLFHAEIASSFEFDDVAAAFVRKMRARAPYLFDGSTGIVPLAVQTDAWEAGKVQ